MEVLNSPRDEAAHHRCWEAIVAKAEAIIEVVQNWRPDYFVSVDPICSFIIYLAGMVLVLNGTVRVDRSSPTKPVSGHLDLLRLFLSQVGRYYAIGRSHPSPVRYPSTLSPL